MDSGTDGDDLSDRVYGAVDRVRGHLTSRSFDLRGEMSPPWQGAKRSFDPRGEMTRWESGKSGNRFPVHVFDVIYY